MSCSFFDFDLVEPIQRAVAAEKYTTPTPIQAESIPHLIAGRDLLGCAQTGTGKTAAFALPILHRLDRNRTRATPRAPRVLVLCPTRELASQIAQSFETYGRFLHFRHTVVFGGVSQNPQVRAMHRGVHVLIATPGRLLDLMTQGHIRLNDLDTFVLDEADRMLDMGFLPDLKRIIAHLPQQRQSIFFSATMPPSIQQLASRLLRDPVQVVVTPQSSTVDDIEQQVMYVERSDKRALLRKVLDQPEMDRVLVFTRTKRGADNVARQLDRTGVKTDAIHGGKSQSARERVLRGFRSGGLRVLVATDVAARGIDIDGVTHVINYDLPQEPECYVHRIGRTGRAGASGTALTFCDATERGGLRAIERLIGRTLNVFTDHPFHSNAQEQPQAKAPQRSRGKKAPYGGSRSSGVKKTRRAPVSNRL